MRPYMNIKHIRNEPTELMHDMAEQLGAALYSDEWRTREYAIAWFSMYRKAFPEFAQPVEYYEAL
jgi:uncharacterized protein (DUF608 family)